MRSKIGTTSRLAAHLLALALLILMLVYVPPQRAGEPHPKNSRTNASQASPSQRGQVDRRPEEDNAGLVATPGPVHLIAPHATQEITRDATATLDQIHTLPEGRRAPAMPLRPPETGPETGGTVTPDSRPAPAPFVAPPPAAVKSPEVKVSSVPAAHSETVEGTSVAAVAEGQTAARNPAAGTAPAQPEAKPLAPTSGISSGQAASSESIALAVPPVSPDKAAEQPPVPQPDESGSLVVADSQPLTAALTPLANANLEVLGDGVYWLSSQHDLEKELAAVPEIGLLILLAPLPGFRATGLEHVKTEVVPADPGDLSHDAAEHFLHLADKSPKPVVVAALPGARGVAFFKGAYLLAKRNIAFADILREIDPELREADGDQGDLVHRLQRLKDGPVL